jgi:hypothetical protein
VSSGAADRKWRDITSPGTQVVGCEEILPISNRGLGGDRDAANHEHRPAALVEQGSRQAAEQHAGDRAGPRDPITIKSASIMSPKATISSAGS